MNIYLIRHAKQDTDFCNLDVSLSQVGRKQAELLGKRLSRYPIDGLYSSNLIRAMETAQIAYHTMQELSASPLNLNHEIRQGLQEISFGDLTGVPIAELNQFFKQYNQAHKPFEEDFCFPGGENGMDVCKRMLPVIEEIVHSGKQHVAVVSHGSAIRAVLADLFTGEIRKRKQFAIYLENCSITQLYYNEKNGHFYLERFNDYAHLEEEPDLLRRNS